MRIPPATMALVLAPVFSVLFLTGCESTSGYGSSGTRAGEAAPVRMVLRPTGRRYTGKASWYTVRTNHGTQTASGERLNDSAFTAAHRSLPFGTKVKVTNLKNGASSVVRITDRGPYISGRVIDMSMAAARRLQMVTAGVVPVSVEVMEEIAEPVVAGTRKLFRRDRVKEVTPKHREGQWESWLRSREGEAEVVAVGG